MRRVVVECFVSVCLLLGGVLGLAPRITSAQAAPEIVLYASEAPVRSGWNVVSDSTAAGGARLANPNLGAPKLAAPLASPISEGAR